MANTFIQGTGTTSALSGTTLSLAYGSNVTVGNLLISTLRHGGPPQTVSSVSDSMGVGNVWTLVYDTIVGAGTISGAFAYVFTKGSGPCTVNWNMGGSEVGGVICVGEWNGPDSVRSTPAANPLTTQTLLVSNSVTAVVNDLLVGLFDIANGSGATPVAQGSVSAFTLRASGTSGGVTFAAITDSLSPSAGSQNAQLVITGTQAGSISGIGDFFAAGFSVSGSAGKAGATVSYSGTASGSVVADGSGNFTIPTLFNGTYTITPSFTGFTFTPTSRTVNVVSANVTGVNFTATASGGGTAFDITFRGRLWVTRVVTGL